MSMVDGCARRVLGSRRTISTADGLGGRDGTPGDRLVGEYPPVANPPRSKRWPGRVAYGPTPRAFAVRIWLSRAPGTDPRLALGNVGSIGRFNH